jgi:hypothetical protein
MVAHPHQTCVTEHHCGDSGTGSSGASELPPKPRHNDALQEMCQSFLNYFSSVLRRESEGRLSIGWQRYGREDFPSSEIIPFNRVIKEAW